MLTSYFQTPFHKSKSYLVLQKIPKTIPVHTAQFKGLEIAKKVLFKIDISEVIQR